MTKITTEIAKTIRLKDWDTLTTGAASQGEASRSYPIDAMITQVVRGKAYAAGNGPEEVKAPGLSVD